jgi:hypothetical protein
MGNPRIFSTLIVSEAANGSSDAIISAITEFIPPPVASF